MKLWNLLLFAFFMATGAQAFAAMNLSGTVDEVWCGELDPFFGDTCVAFVVNDENQKYGLVLDFDAWQTNHPDQDALSGKPFSAASCEIISDFDALKSLKNFNDQYFYLDCYSVSIEVNN